MFKEKNVAFYEDSLNLMACKNGPHKKHFEYHETLRIIFFLFFFIFYLYFIFIKMII